MRELRQFSFCKMTLRCATTLLIVGLSTYHANAQAQDGAFDPTFGDSGRTIFDLGSKNNPKTVSETSDGHLLIEGTCTSSTDACLTRLNADGSIDSSYGPLHTGTARLDQFGGAPANATAFTMLLLPDGRAVLGGTVNFSPTLFVVRADGTGFDMSVGGGKGYLTGVQGSAKGANSVTSLARQKSGKYIALMGATDSVYGTYILVSRIAADLSGLDTTFGSGGTAAITFSYAGDTGNEDEGTAVAVQADDAIVVAGIGLNSLGFQVPEFARLLPDGGADGSFTRHDVLSDPYEWQPLAIAIAPDQSIVFGGQSYDQGRNKYQQLVGKLMKNGLLDDSFHYPEGYILFDAVTNTTGVEAVSSVIATSDSVIALGNIPRSNGSSDQYFEVSRFDLSSGVPAAGFGASGHTYASFAADDTGDFAPAAILTTRGLVVVGSSVPTSGTTDVGVARFKYDHIFGNAFQ